MHKTIAIISILLGCICCKRRDQPHDTRLVHEEEIILTNATDKAAILSYVDTLQVRFKPSKSFSITLPKNATKKLSLGSYYVGESKGFMDYCALGAHTVIVFEDGKTKRDTSCFSTGILNIKDATNFFKDMKIVMIGRSEYNKIYTYEYTITGADYAEAR